MVFSSWKTVTLQPIVILLNALACPLAVACGLIFEWNQRLTSSKSSWRNGYVC